MLSKIFVACICMAAFLTTTAQDIAVTNNQTTLTETKTEPEDELMHTIATILEKRNTTT